jgi:hypothetical protein
MALKNSELESKILERAETFFEVTKEAFAFLSDLGYETVKTELIESKVFALIPCVEYESKLGRQLRVSLGLGSLTYDKDDWVGVSIWRTTPNHRSEQLFVDLYIARNGEMSEESVGHLSKGEDFAPALRTVLDRYSKCLRGELLGVVDGSEWKAGYHVDLA